MTQREVIQKVKQTIKSLADKQSLDKALLGQDHRRLGTTLPEVQGRALDRRVMLTALHNFYNDLRGINYRHSISLKDRRLYEQDVDKISEDFQIREKEVTA